MSFEEWMQQVNVHLGALVGLGHRDIADWRYRDAYDDEVSPREAALSALDNDMGWAAVENILEV